MHESLSKQQARKVVLLSQRLPPKKKAGSAITATLAVIEHLGYIQIDTISAVERAHHHTLWNRNPRYRVSHIDKLLAEKQVFEYWAHAAAYLPMRDYRFSLFRKGALASGEQGHWYNPDKKLMNHVLKRIASEGPLMAKDFEHNGEKVGEWASKPAKQALETLFMQGELMIPYRVNFHKVYDLTERVVPHSIDRSSPTKEEYVRFLIIRYLKANGLGSPAEVSYLLKSIKQLVTDTMKEMVLSGELVQVRVGTNTYYTLPESLELLNRPLARSKLKILSPFDNLLIQRKRMRELFEFDYQIECYLPEKKRQFGYFSLPVLWGGKLVARMDCKVDRKKSVMFVKHLALENTLNNVADFGIALRKELTAFMEFNNCSNVQLQMTTPQDIEIEL